MFPAIFLDRDGVILENRSDYIREWAHVDFIPGALRSLSHPGLTNYRVVIVTNQSAVGRGLLPLETALAINDRFMKLVHSRGGRLDGIYMCPHAPAERCSCRKPEPGLLLQAARELDLDLSRSWMVGDAWSDVQAGQAAGVQGLILLRTGRGAEQLAQPQPSGLQPPLVLDDLPAALEEIFSRDTLPGPPPVP